MSEELSELYLAWSKRRKEVGKIYGDEKIIEESWEELEDQALVYIWLAIR